MGRQEERRTMIPSVLSTLADYLYLAPAFLMVLAVLVGLGVIAVPEAAKASQKLERTITVDGLRRTYTVYLPDNAGSQRDLRVMFVFHPAIGTGEFMEKSTQLHATPGADKFVVVYPDGYRRTWNAGECCGMAERQRVDDVAFFRAMMNDISTLAKVRPKAYLTGWSNGALLVYYLMCNASDQVAAAAPFAAYLPPQSLANCPGGPVPLLHMHGAADPGAPVEGGQTNYLGYLPPARQTVEAIARWNGADVANPTYVDMPNLGTSCLHYGNRGTEANLCIIPDLGHVWPGMKTRDGGGKMGPDRPDLKGSRAVIEFFMKH